MTRADSPEAGFVLPAVLAVLIVIAAAAAAATQHLQARTALATARLDGLRLQGLADGVARLVSVSLVAERARRMQGLGLPEDGTPIACPLPGGGVVQVAVQDQAGLIDLNASPHPLLEAAFQALGVPDREAATLAAEVVDDRDPDDAPEPGGGAEAPQYKARGLSYGPRNAPYSAVDELDRLPSMTPATAALLRPAMTIWNQGGGIDPTVNRAQGLRRGVASDRLRQYVKSSSHQFYEIRVMAENATGSRSGRAAILSADARSTGIGLLSWRASATAAPATITHPACTRILRAVDAL